MSEVKEEKNSAPSIENLQALLKDNERRILQAQKEFFATARELARARSERLHSKHRELVLTKSRIEKIGERLDAITLEQLAIRDRAADELVERNEERVSELQRAHARLESEAINLRYERSELQAKLRTFGGVPDSTEELQDVTSFQRRELRKEIEGLERSFSRGVREGIRRIETA